MSQDAATFSLRPFEPLPTANHLSISGTITRTDNVLSISYLMAGDLDAVCIPATNTSRHRTDRLWEQTCLEFFLTAGPQKSDEDAYWEFNLSPTGDWNVFALEGYRQGLREETAFTALPFSISRSAAGLQLEISVDLSALLPNLPWLVGISAVGLLANGKETFWAIAHPGPEADFHSIGSFVVALPLSSGDK